MKQTFADATSASFARDGDGRLIGVTPPSRPAHAFSYEAAGKFAAYTPPSAGAFAPATAYTHNADNDLDTITYPGGGTLTVGYDASGRPSAHMLPGGAQNTFAYHATTGHMNMITSASGSTLALMDDGPFTTERTWGGATAGTVTTANDNSLRLASVKVNALAPIAFTYGNDGLTRQAGALALTRDATTGFLTGGTLGVVTDTATYNSFGELETVAASINANAAFALDKIAAERDTRDRADNATHQDPQTGEAIYAESPHPEVDAHNSVDNSFASFSLGPFSLPQFKEMPRRSWETNNAIAAELGLLDDLKLSELGDRRLESEQTGKDPCNPCPPKKK